MKSYKYLKEDIGLSTGVGIASYDLPLTKPAKRKSIFEALGICEDCMEAMSLVEGKMMCLTCSKKGVEEQY
jgi:hypothetical protein